MTKNENIECRGNENTAAQRRISPTRKLSGGLPDRTGWQLFVESMRNSDRMNSKNIVSCPLTPSQWLPKPATSQLPQKSSALRAMWSPDGGEGETTSVITQRARPMWQKHPFYRATGSPFHPDQVQALGWPSVAFIRHYSPFHGGRSACAPRFKTIKCVHKGEYIT